MRRNWFIAAIVIGVAAIVIAAIAMRLSNDSGTSSPSAAEWAGSVCTDLVTWKTSISSLTTGAGGGQLNADVIKQKIDTAQTATATLVSELKALGPPDLESGDQLKQDLATSADELQATFDSLKQGAEQATSAGSPSEVIKGLAALGPQFQKLVNEASTTVKTLQNANVAAGAKSELQAAFADAPACQQLSGNG